MGWSASQQAARQLGGRLGLTRKDEGRQIYSSGHPHPPPPLPPCALQVLPKNTNTVWKEMLFNLNCLANFYHTNWHAEYVEITANITFSKLYPRPCVYLTVLLNFTLQWFVCLFDSTEGSIAWGDIWQWHNNSDYQQAGHRSAGVQGQPLLPLECRTAAGQTQKTHPKYCSPPHQKKIHQIVICCPKIFPNYWATPTKIPPHCD